MEKYRNINILYEDNHILVVQKPANMPVCLDESNDIDLLSILKKYIKEKYQKPGAVYLGLVHRLDRPVEGVMVFAKTSKAASRLSKQIQDKTMQKTYYAVVENIPPKSGKFTDYMLKNSKTNTSYITTKDKGKEAILDFETLKSVNNLSLVKINLITGRHHQIRLQFKTHNYPLYGDHRYNLESSSNNKDTIALVARTLTFDHPTTKEKLTFTIDLPKRYPFNLF